MWITLQYLDAMNSSIYHYKTSNTLKKLGLGSAGVDYRFEETMIGHDLSNLECLELYVFAIGDKETMNALEKLITYIKNSNHVHPYIWIYKVFLMNLMQNGWQKNYQI